MSNTELIPCPICGGEAFIEFSDPRLSKRGIFRKEDILWLDWEIRCNNCGLSLPARTSKYKIMDNDTLFIKRDGRSELIEAWNGRVNEV